MRKLLCVVLSLLLCLTAAAACAEAPAWKVTAPAGAPALALATLAVENPDAYTFVAADTIAAEFAKAEADFIIAPLNAGAKLFAAGKSVYQVAAVVSWGNLYFASQKENFQLSDISGAKITLFGENTINSSIALYALEANGIEAGEVEYLAGAANTQALLLENPDAIVLTAEPALTAASFKNEKVKGYPVNDLYKTATGFDGYTQAALFVNPEAVKADPAGVAAFLAEVAASCAKCTEDVPAVAEAAVTLEILPNAKVAAAAIPHCAIRFVSALEAREQIEATANVDLSQFGGAVPADGFYYAAE